MNSPAAKRLGLIVVICALAGALAGIAGSAAAPSKKSSKATWAQGARRAHRFATHGRPPFGPRFGPGPAVHGEIVVPNANGDDFDKITTDAGTLTAIEGNTLTIKEGTDKATYGEPKIDVGDSPTVFRNHEKAALGDLKTGDLVRVVQGPKMTLVWAEDPAFKAQERTERGHFRRGFGPPPPGAYPGGSYGGGSSGSSDSNS